MYSLILECKVITPMFMAGTDGKTPELRPSEFKGMMRFWWRALKADNDIERLRKEENEIFGGTGKGEGKSRVWLKIPEYNFSIGNDIRIEISGYNGIKYLYYSTFSLKNKGEPIIRSYINPGGTFKINLCSFEEKSFNRSLASLWLAIYLGGFGTRARRGAGNIAIEEINDRLSEQSELNFICNADSKKDLKIWLSQNIGVIKSIIGQANGTSNYSVLKKGRILIFDPKDSWKDALNFLGEKFKEFRNQNKSRIFETAVFGMPIMHSRFRVRIVPYDNRGERVLDRWASPLFIRILKGEKKKYFPILTQLSPGGISFVGKEESIKKGNCGKKVKAEFKTDLLYEFIYWLKRFESEEIEL